MKTAYDEDILVGTMVKSTKFNQSGGEFQCVKVRDGWVHLRGGATGDSAFTLDQAGLDESYWKVCGFKDMGEGL